MSVPDLRRDFWAGLGWFDALEAPVDDLPSTWFLAKGPPDRPHVQLANVALLFARDLGLEAHYRAKFAGISAHDLRTARARAEHRAVSTPLWEILNELVVGSLVANVLEWRPTRHEPPGHGACRGDWEFVLPDGRPVFVEVKSLAEPEYPTGAFTRPHFAHRLQSVLKGAYRQLPSDHRANVVFLVAPGGIMLDTRFGIVHGDVFQAFFGETVFAFSFDGESLSSPRLTSTFRHTFVQRRKNRRLGAVFGLSYAGLTMPSPNLYLIHNPFATESCAVPLVSTIGLSRSYVGEKGPTEERGMSGDELWRKWIARL